LHLAAERGHVGVVRVLLERGAFVAVRGGCRKETPLMVAAFEQHKDVVCLLLDKGADIEDCYKDGQTSLQCAADY
ncbi:ankyrin repeat-containing domain protein, partial [Schizophyllum commune]